jgi:hypothetical protein
MDENNVFEFFSRLKSNFVDYPEANNERSILIPQIVNLSIFFSEGKLSSQKFLN